MSSDQTVILLPGDGIGPEIIAPAIEVLGAVGGPAILIATRGQGELKARGKTYDLKEGYTYFVAPGVETEFSTEKGLLFRESCFPSSSWGGGE